jgi:rhodanese-related sulfurtransferase
VAGNLSTEQLLRRLSDVVLVDALGAPYFHNAHLRGAVNIPPHQVDEMAPRHLPDKSAPIVVYGGSGSSNADIVTGQLVRMGYADVSVYADGITGWVGAGLPVERPQDQAHD